MLQEKILRGLLNLCDTATQVAWILPTCVTVWLAAGNPATRLTAAAPSVWPSNWPSDTWITLYVTWDTEQTQHTESLSSTEVQILLGIKTDYLPFGLTLINSLKLDNDMISHLPTCSFCLENILDGLVAEGGRRLNSGNCCWILSCGYGTWKNKVFRCPKEQNTYIIFRACSKGVRRYVDTQHYEYAWFSHYLLRKQPHSYQVQDFFVGCTEKEVKQLFKLPSHLINHDLFRGICRIVQLLPHNGACYPTHLFISARSLGRGDRLHSLPKPGWGRS